MLHADHSILQIIGHVMIAFLFLFRGVTSLPEFARHTETLGSHRIPFPRFILVCGFVVMLVGGAMVLIDFYSPIAAGGLILFTVIANFTYHDFWKMTEPRQRQTHLWIFCNNIAVMGGLILVVAS